MPEFTNQFIEIDYFSQAGVGEKQHFGFLWMVKTPQMSINESSFYFLSLSLFTFGPSNISTLSVTGVEGEVLNIPLMQLLSVAERGAHSSSR